MWVENRLLPQQKQQRNEWRWKACGWNKRVNEKPQTLCVTFVCNVVDAVTIKHERKIQRHQRDSCVF